MQIVRPAELHLPSYIAALEQGWSSDSVRGAVAAREELQEIATDGDRLGTNNVASQRAIKANGGVLVEEFMKSPQHGGKPGLRFRIFFQ